MSEWQPISTAPKDGTLIDIWMSGFRYSDSYWGKAEQAWLDDAGEKLYDIFFEEPTHWMPIPEPPKGHEHGRS